MRYNAPVFVPERLASLRAARSALKTALRPDALLWRRAMAAGVRHGPEAWLRYSPPVFGVAFGAALREQRGIVRRNLRRVHGRRPAPIELADTARVFGTYASCLTEAFLLGQGRGYVLRSQSQGVEHYHACAAEGRGVIIATAHTAGWEMAGPVLSGVHTGDVVVVMQREPDDAARAIQDEARTRAGVKVEHIGTSALDALTLLGHLRRNAVVALQIDRVPAGMRCRTATLFGAPWQVPEGPLSLAAVSGAAILPVFTRRLGFMHYEAIVAPPVRLPRRPTPEALDAAAQAITNALENFIRLYPTQWFHFVD